MTDDPMVRYILLCESLNEDGYVVQCWPLCAKGKGVLLFDTAAQAEEYAPTLPVSRRKITVARVEIPDAFFEVTLN
jgi:hypothetical protein